MKKFVFISTLLLLTILVAGGVAFIQFKNYGNKNKPVGLNNIGQINPYLRVPCISNPKVSFTNNFTETDKIRDVFPTIVIVGNSRHRVFLNIDTPQYEKVAVYAPVDSELVGGVYKNVKGALDYDFRFQVSCEIWYLINHITEPEEKFKKLFPYIPQDHTRDPPPLKERAKVKAGELLGYTSGTPLAHNFDFAVFDLNHANEDLPGDPPGSNYGLEKNFICPFDVLPKNLKKMYYSKIIISEKPYSNCKTY